jgi:hypothetical protein
MTRYLIRDDGVMFVYAENLAKKKNFRLVEGVHPEEKEEEKEEPKEEPKEESTKKAGRPRTKK